MRISLVCLTGVLFAAALPLVATTAPEADPAAVALMKKVYSQRETWGADFKGFTADVKASVGAKSAKGTASVGPTEVSVDLPNEEVQAWATEVLASILQHRRAADFSANDGRYALTFGPRDKHPQGRLVKLNDEGGSTYRIRGDRLMQINRSAGPRMRFTIDMLGYAKTDRGKYLPRLYSVSYFDSDSGALLRQDTIIDVYSKVGGFYLPTRRRLLKVEKGATVLHVLTLSNHKLKQ